MQENKEKFLKGLRESAKMVISTYGANGNTVIVPSQNPMFAPGVTKDGVTVAKLIDFEDIHENTGNQFTKRNALTIESLCTDGTTTGTVLLKAIVDQGENLIEAGNKHKDILSGMGKALKDTLSMLKELSKATEQDNLRQVALVSTNNDEELGELVFKAHKKCDTVDVVQSNDEKSEVVFSGGMIFDRGWESPYFVTRPDKRQSVLENSLVLIVDGEIKTMQEILPALEMSMKEAKPICIIADSFSDEVLEKLIESKLKNGFEVNLIKTAKYGKDKAEVLEDLAFYCGAKVWDNGIDSPYEVGSVDKIISEEETTTFFSTIDVAPRVAQIKKSKGSEKRITNISGKSATIFVGGQTEAEAKERKDRVDDAVGAVKCAKEEGFVAGGGSTLYFIAQELRKNDYTDIGYNEFLLAISEPFKILSGFDVGADLKYGEGINLNTGKLTDLFFEGVIDPTKVLRVCLETSFSTASLVIKTEYVL